MIDRRFHCREEFPDKAKEKVEKALNGCNSAIQDSTKVYAAMNANSDNARNAKQRLQKAIKVRLQQISYLVGVGAYWQERATSHGVSVTMYERMQFQERASKHANQ